jgi:hypothetical protein
MSSPVAPRTSSIPQDAAPDVAVAIDRSARYLAALCDEQGRFTYRTHLDPAVALPPAYNVLRHAGAVYALAQYCQRSPDAEVQAAMQRGADFLRRKCVGPVADHPNLLAVWSDPDVTGDAPPRQAKLGGAGLALVALLNAERVAPGSTPLDQLRALGRFLIFMQKGDGSFYSKYFPDSGRSDAWQSDYYPGEAALGLLLLYERDPALPWLRAAAQALDQLAQRGTREPATFPDQWFLLAAERLWVNAAETPVPVNRELLLAHARRICLDMLADQQRQADDPQLAGCYTPDGRSCPTATRLEGLLAATSFLLAAEPSLTDTLRQSIDDGVRFLLRCQIPDGPQAGAFPRVLSGFEPSADQGDGVRAQEVRIDYVQHALSALIQYEQIVSPARDAR